MFRNLEGKRGKKDEFCFDIIISESDNSEVVLSGVIGHFEPDTVRTLCV